MTLQQASEGEILVETNEESVVLPVQELQTKPHVEREIEIVCVSGERIESVWEGLPVSILIEEYSLPIETTHFSFTSQDGYRCCLPIQTALNGILATKRDGICIGSKRSYSTRFVAPGVEGVRCLKDVRTIQPLSLEADEARTDYEQLGGTGDDSPDKDE